MSKQPQQSELNTDDQLIAVVQRVGGTWRCLVASNSDGAHPEIVETIQIQSEDGLESLLGSVQPKDLYVILPGSATVCRTTSLPDVDHDQMLQALRLQAESKFLGGTPEHRRTVSTLDTAPGETNRVGIIVAWPESSNLDLPKCLQGASFIPDAASIAALLDGSRPTDPLLYADSTDGTITIALSHANGAALRATREDTSSASTFLDGISRIVRETASTHNHTTAFTDSLVSELQLKLSEQSCTEPILFLPDEVKVEVAKRIDGVPYDNQTWWSMWGINVGGLLAAIGSLKSLTTMKMHAPVLHPSMSERFVTRCSKKAVALKLAIASLLLLAVGPALISGMKLSVLNLLNPNLEAEYNSAVEKRKQQIIYKHLGKSAWPITKITADVINNIPIGIDIESFRINSGEPISIRGAAQDKDGKTAAELIAKMQEKLASTGIFKDIQFSYKPATTFGKRDFDLWATVINPLTRPRYTVKEDFGIWTNAMQKAGIQPDEQNIENEYGSNASTETSSDDSPMQSANPDSQASNQEPPAFLGDEKEVVDRRDTGRGLSGSSNIGTHTGDRNPGGRNSSRIPDPLTPEQIGVMDENETRNALSEVAEGLKHLPNSDEETKLRLNTEMRLLFDRLKDIKE